MQIAWAWTNLFKRNCLCVGELQINLYQYMSSDAEFYSESESVGKKILRNKKYFRENRYFLICVGGLEKICGLKNYHTPFVKHFDMDKLIWNSLAWAKKGRRGRTSLSLAWEIAHAYLFSPTPENFKTFVYIEMHGKWSLNFEIR